MTPSVALSQVMVTPEKSVLKPGGVAKFAFIVYNVSTSKLVLETSDPVDSEMKLNRRAGLTVSGAEAFKVTVESEAVTEANVIAVVVVAVIETATVSLVSKVVRRVGETVKEPPPVKNVPVGTAARVFENTKR